MTIALYALAAWLLVNVLVIFALELRARRKDEGHAMKSLNNSPTLKSIRLQGMRAAGDGVSPTTAHFTAHISYKDDLMRLTFLEAYKTELQRLKRKKFRDTP